MATNLSIEQQHKQAHEKNTALPKPPAPTLPDYPNNIVPWNELTSDLQVDFTFDDLAPDHTVAVRYRGKNTYYTPVQTVVEGNKLTFKIPPSEIKVDIGGTARLSASVGVGDDPVIVGEMLTIRID